MGDLIQVEKDLHKKLLLIENGRNYWLSFEKYYSFQSNDFVIVIPAIDNEEIELAIKYLEPFYTSKNIDRLFIFTPNIHLSQDIKKNVNSVFECITLTIEEMDSLLNLYALYPFSDRLIIASFTLPHGRTLLNLENKKGVTKEEIMAIGIYQLKQVEIFE